MIFFRPASLRFPLVFAILAFTRISLGGWAFLPEGEDWQSASIPDDCSAKLKELSAKGTPPKYLAFSRSGAWIILLGPHDYAASKVPADAIAQLDAFAKRGLELKSVALGPAHSWVILANDDFASAGIPDEAAQYLAKLRQERASIKDFAFSPKGWAVISGKNQYFCRNIPDDAFNKIRQLASAGADLRGIRFIGPAGWVILYDKTGCAVAGLPEDLSRQLEPHLKSGVRSIAFLPSFLHLSLDDPQTRREVLQRMEQNHIPGLSVALIENGKIAWARGYGVADSKGAEVTERTLFQAASLSKPVAAVAALQLVERGKFDLDADINRALTSWKIPANNFTRQQPVTLRLILSHSAGFTVHGFAGYVPGKPVPSLIQVLNGAGPANSPPIVVNNTPGEKFAYSGGGFCVLQQAMIDVTSTLFPKLMQDGVLGPLKMSSSTYEQPLPSALASLAAVGHKAGKPLPERWHVYPEMAAAGLWTTPSDLGRFVMALQAAWKKDPGSVLSPELVKQMLTPQKNGWGLGIGLSGTGRFARFDHDGLNEGFQSRIIGYLETGQGAVLMINSDGAGVDAFLNEITSDLSIEYDWPG